MTASSTYETTLIDALRDARQMPRRTVSVDAAGLRATLTDGIYTILGEAQPEIPYVVRPSSMRRTTDAVAYTPFGRMRGALITQLVRLMASDVAIDNLFCDAVLAWRASEGASELVDVFASLDDDELARLATDVTAHAVTLTQRLGTPPSAWMPRTAVRSALRLIGGGVLLRDHVDLVLGNANVGGVALVDITTSVLDEAMERAMRFHAVVETLKNGVAPRFIAALSTATGELWRFGVDDELLNRGTSDILAALQALVVTR